MTVEGTYACPICGCATPHAHSPEQIAEWRKSEIAPELNAEEFDARYMEHAAASLKRINEVVERLFPNLVVIGTTADLVEAMEKILIEDRNRLRKAIGSDQPDSYWRLHDLVKAVLDNAGVRGQ